MDHFPMKVWISLIILGRSISARPIVLIYTCLFIPTLTIIVSVIAQTRRGTMSLQSHIALGKNMSLQRQLDGKYVEFKKAFRSSRRRLDSMEEECVSSLYKLLLEAKANKRDNEPAGRRSVTPDLTRDRSRSKSVPIITRPQSEVSTPRKTSEPLPARPVTSMSSRTYTQSYSFRTDGLDISRYTRGGVKKKNKKPAEDVKRPLSVVGVNPFSDRENIKEININDSASGLLDTQGLTADQLGEQAGNGQVRHNNQTSSKIRPATSILKNRKGEQIMRKVHEGNTQLDEFRPLSVTITHTTPLEHPIYSTDNIDGAITPRPDTAVEDELLPLITDDDDNTQNSKSTKPKDSKRNGGSSRTNPVTQYRRFRSPSRADSVDSDTARSRSIQDQQKFLAEYSRRSKLFGYVVKSKSASIFQDKGRRISRSPCVTYQELVGIKSSMRQQESRTKTLLNRSAKLSTYVDQLAMASQYRQHIQALRSGKTPDS